MRRWQAVFVSAIFAVAILSMYILLDQTLQTPDSGKMSLVEENELNQLEDRLKVLEFDIQRNRDTIQQVRNSINFLSSGKALAGRLDFGEDGIGDPGGDPVPDYPDFKLDGNGNGGGGLAVEVGREECSFADSSDVSSADVKILEVFKLLKFDNPNGGVWKQGFEITYNKDDWNRQPLKVIVVPHSHNDPGWIKTFDKYYADQTQHILNNMVVKLHEDKRRTFIWAEISYFSKWWDTIDKQKKDAVMQLVSRGQLEIVSGGWVMPDEANTHYYAVLDQLIEGHQWLEANLGIKPKSSWAIDPFGHSPLMAYIYKKSGLHNMLIQRVHYSIKKHLASAKNLEFMWRQTWDHSSGTDMFCHMMPFYSYDVPHSCGPDPKVCCQFDFKRLPGGRVTCPWKVPPVLITENNVANRAQVLLDQYRKKSKLYRSNVVLVPLGDDFRYDKTIEWDQQFKNYQKIFDYMNSHKELKVEVQFGTLSSYFDAIYERTGTQSGEHPQGYPVLSGDFYTYSDREDHYWSGYYTSRPFYKHMDRVLEADLRSAEIAASLALAKAQQHNAMDSFPANLVMSKLTKSRRSLGLFQHHDAITGTAKDPVVVDYGNKLLNAIKDSKEVMAHSIHYLLSQNKASYEFKPELTHFDLDEIRESHDSLPVKQPVILSKDSPTPIVIYNSLAKERWELVRLLVSTDKVELKDANGKIQLSQLNLVWVEKASAATDVYELVFVAHVGPLALTTYTLREVSVPNAVEHIRSKTTLYNTGIVETAKWGHFTVFKESTVSDFTIENAWLKAKFSGQDGMLKSIITKSDGKETKVEIDFKIYGTQMTKDKSGAYLFLPDGDAKPFRSPSSPLIRVVRGQLMSEVKVFMDHVQHTISLPKSPGVDGTALEVENLVDIRSERNKELVMQIRTGVKNPNGDFFTDLNGFQVQKRQYYHKLPLQANFYPMPSMAYIEDTESRFSIITAQPLGVSSLNQGWLEVMQDRRLMQDDNRGLQQGVTDNKRTPNKFRFLLERREKDAGPRMGSGSMVGYPSLLSHSVVQSLTHRLNLLPKSLKSPANLLTEYRPLARPLPCDLHLLNLRTYQNPADPGGLPGDGALLLLHRQGFQCGFPTTGLTCDMNGGKVTLREMFKDLDPVEVRSTSLTMMYNDQETLDPSSTISVEPMEISAFKVKFS